jgi:hypothetical protein
LLLTAHTAPVQATNSRNLSRIRAFREFSTDERNNKDKGNAFIGAVQTDIWRSGDCPVNPSIRNFRLKSKLNPPLCGFFYVRVGSTGFDKNRNPIFPKNRISLTLNRNRFFQKNRISLTIEILCKK